MENIKTINPLIVSGEEAYRALLNAAFTTITTDKSNIISFTVPCEQIMKNIETKPPLYIAYGQHAKTSWRDTWLKESGTFDLLSRAAVNYFVSCESTFILDSGPNDNSVNAATLLDFDNVFKAICKYGDIMFSKDDNFSNNLKSCDTITKHLIAFEYLLHQVKSIEWSKYKNVESRS